MITLTLTTIKLLLLMVFSPISSPMCDSIAERTNDTLTADTVALRSEPLSMPNIEMPASEVSIPNTLNAPEGTDPMTGLALVQPPTANNRGTADIYYPIEIPAGRQGMQPNLTLSYNSVIGQNGLENKNNTQFDSVMLRYWNVLDGKYNGYSLFYIPEKKEILLYTDWIKSSYKMIICSEQEIDYFEKAIISFFINKSEKIVEKKIKKNEIICTDYPTFSIDVYKSKKLESVHVMIDEEDCSPIFTIEFTEFIDFINDLTKKHDQMIDRINNQDTYRCRIK